MLSPTNSLLVVSVLDILSFGLLMPQMANHVRSIGGNHITIGIMGTLYSGSQLISGPIVVLNLFGLGAHIIMIELHVQGSLSDIRGRKPIILLSLSICGIGYLLLGLTSSVFIFLVLRLIIGLSKQTQLLTKALGPDYIKDSADKSVLYGRMASFAGIGMSVGPIIGGHIMELFPEKGFTVITTIMATIFAFNLTLMKNLPEIKKEKKEVKPQVTSIAPKLIDSIRVPLKESIGEFYKIDWTVFGDIFVFKLLMTLCMMMYFQNFGVFIRLVHSVSPKNLGYIIAFQSITGSIGTYFIGYINKFYKNDNDYTQRNFHVFVTVTLTIIGIALSPNIYIFILLLIPLAVASSIGRIISLEMVTSRSKSDNRGTVIGASNSVKSLSGVFTPLIAGFINQYYGIVYVFFIAASFSAAGSVFSYRLRQRSIASKDK